MSFAKLKENLQAEGWFVGWNLPCCQSCAWGDLPYEHEDGPFKGQRVDLSKVLFNHSQDCELECDVECDECFGEGYLESTDDDCSHCGGTGYLPEEDFDAEQYDTSVYGFVCYYPEQQCSSLFCFDGTDEGIENLKEILPIIEKSGCSVSWNESGDSRIEISWR